MKDDIIILDRKLIKTTYRKDSNILIAEFGNVRIEIKDITFSKDYIEHRNIAVDLMKFFNLRMPMRFNNFNIVSCLLLKDDKATTYIHIYTLKIKKIKEDKNDK